MQKVTIVNHVTRSLKHGILFANFVALNKAIWRHTVTKGTNLVPIKKHSISPYGNPSQAALQKALRFSSSLTSFIRSKSIKEHKGRRHIHSLRSLNVVGIADAADTRWVSLFQPFAYSSRLKKPSLIRVAHSPLRGALSCADISSAPDTMTSHHVVLCRHSPDTISSHKSRRSCMTHRTTLRLPLTRLRVADTI